MSSRVLIMNLLPLLFSAVLVVCSLQSTTPLKSFKISGNVTYDCIDIYKQPGIDHPLLRNHTIQLKPSITRPEVKNHIANDKTSNEKKMGCPKGTVPILRSTKDFIKNRKSFPQMSFQPLSKDKPGTHTAGVMSRISSSFHGIEAWFSGFWQNLAKDQASYSEIYIGSGLDHEVNFLSAGLMVNPTLFPDTRIWKYGFWKGKNGKGCYNKACPGFIQVSSEIPIVEPFDREPGIPAWLNLTIHQDKNTGNWWITQGMQGPRYIDIGYWPKDLFNILDNGAQLVGAGGVVQTSHSGLSPPMGNGRFPSNRIKRSAVFTNVNVLNSDYEKRQIDDFPIEKVIDSKCYDIKIGRFDHSQTGYLFNYGGPGGHSCGI